MRRRDPLPTPFAMGLTGAPMAYIGDVPWHGERAFGQSMSGLGLGVSACMVYLPT